VVTLSDIRVGKGWVRKAYIFIILDHCLSSYVIVFTRFLLGSTPAASTSLRPPTRGLSGYGWQAIPIENNGERDLAKAVRHSLGDGGRSNHFELL
jgi:hypothetical protein